MHSAVSINPQTGLVSPDIHTNIPGLSSLKSADVVVFLIRFRCLPKNQMSEILEYTASNRPIVGLRTSTHAFYCDSQPTSWYDFRNHGGWGKMVLGETWQGRAPRQTSTRGLTAPGAHGHPILRGVDAIWARTALYTVKELKNTELLLLGEVLDSPSFNASPALSGNTFFPKMPLAWIRRHKKRRVFTTTMGAAEDLMNEGVRRLVVNAIFWNLGLDAHISAHLDVSTPGQYSPTRQTGDYSKDLTNFQQGHCASYFARD